MAILEFPVAFALAGVLALIHYYSKHIGIGKVSKERINSVTAGVSIAYIFLWLIPEFLSNNIMFNRFFFLFILLGFAGIHFIEKSIVIKVKGSEMKRELSTVHALSFFVYHILIGIIILEFARMGSLEALLFSLPIALHAGASSASLSEVSIISEKGNGTIRKILFSLSTLIGVIIGYILPFDFFISVMITGFVVGLLLYITTRDSMPLGEHGRPIYFLTSVLIYSAFIVILWAL